jgi:hypothetical protein
MQFLAVILLLLACAATAPLAGDKVTWKRIPEAMLKVDNHAVKVWALYHVQKDKKEQRFLLQMGARYLLIDTKLRQVAEYDPATFEKKGETYEMPREAKGVKALPTEDWILRDVGTSYLIQTKLKEEGRVLELELPKLPDFRNFLW